MMRIAIPPMSCQSTRSATKLNELPQMSPRAANVVMSFPVVVSGVSMTYRNPTESTDSLSVRDERLPSK